MSETIKNACKKNKTRLGRVLFFRGNAHQMADELRHVTPDKI